MNVLSLFDGMSCGQIALQRLGIEVDNYYASEIDKYAISIAKKNYPGMVHLGDVTKWRDWDIEWEKIDLVMGGSPCQGFSIAGKQLAFDDPRSKLFFVFMDIVNHVKSLNPNMKFLLENVRMKKEYLDIITQHTGVTPIMINSSLVSAQSRVRYYWTNIENISQPKDKALYIKDVLQDEVDEKYFVSEKIQERIQIFREDLPKNPPIGTTKPSFRTIGQRDLIYGRNQKMGTLVATDYKQPKQILDKPLRLGNISTGTQGNRLYSTKCKSVTVNGSNGGGFYLDELKVRRLTPIECERLQTVPDNYTDGVSNSQRYKMLGNGWTVDVICHILKSLH